MPLALLVAADANCFDGIDGSYCFNEMWKLIPTGQAHVGDQAISFDRRARSIILGLPKPQIDWRCRRRSRSARVLLAAHLFSDFSAGFFPGNIGGDQRRAIAVAQVRQQKAALSLACLKPSPSRLHFMLSELSSRMTTKPVRRRRTGPRRFETSVWQAQGKKIPQESSQWPAAAVAQAIAARDALFATTK